MAAALTTGHVRINQSKPYGPVGPLDHLVRCAAVWRRASVHQVRNALLRNFDEVFDR